MKEGLECGIGVENFNDIKVGDVLEAYKTEEFARSLETAPGAYNVIGAPARTLKGAVKDG